MHENVGHLRKFFKFLMRAQKETGGLVRSSILHPRGYGLPLLRRLEPEEAMRDDGADRVREGQRAAGGNVGAEVGPMLQVGRGLEDVRAAGHAGEPKA